LGLDWLTFHFDLKFDDPVTQRRNENRLLLALEFLAQLDGDYLDDHPETPHLYDTGIAYKRPEQLDSKLTRSQVNGLRKFLKGLNFTDYAIEAHVAMAMGTEMFRQIGRIDENGGTDCDGWSPWRTAELRRAGMRGAKPGVVSREVGGRIIMHTVTMLPDPLPSLLALLGEEAPAPATGESDEDPSLILGMGGAGRFADRLKEIKTCWDRHDFYMDQAKALISAKRASVGEDAARDYARTLLAKIDSLGFVPKDGKFKMIGNEPAQALGVMS
jgi:hypothetical protein